MKQGENFIGVTVVFYCYDNTKRLLLQKRSSNCRDEQGTWDCGGGSVDFGETLEEAVLRELQEEYCVAPEKLDFLGIKNVLRMNGDKKTHWIALIFAVKVNASYVKIGDAKKIDAIDWFMKDALPNPLHSMYLEHLAFVKEAGIV